MRFEYINPFIESAQNVLQSVMPLEVQRKAIKLDDSITTKGVSATIFLIGGAEDRVVLDLEPQLAKRIAGYMNGSEFEHLDKLAIDTICELTNIIIGKAVTSLNNKGFKFKTSPPCFFVGEKFYYGVESVCICLSSAWGDVRIMATIREKPTCLV